MSVVQSIVMDRFREIIASKKKEATIAANSQLDRANALFVELRKNHPYSSQFCYNHDQLVSALASSGTGYTLSKLHLRFKHVVVASLLTYGASQLVIHSFLKPRWDESK